MSFLDGIKKLAIRLTGTQAKVSLTPKHFVIGESVNVEVTVKVHEEDFEVRGAYLLVRGVSELITIEANHEGEPGTPRLQREEFYQQKVNFLESRLFKARENSIFNVSFELGSEASNFSMKAGHKIYYELLAGLDVLGNDPGSNWVVVSEPVKNLRRLK